MAVEPDRRAQIIEAVRSSMGQFGVRRVTVGDIAREAGVSRQTLYAWFPNRDALIEAALEAGARDLVERGRAAGDRVGGAPVDRLTEMIRYALRFLRQSPLWASPAKRAELVPHVTIEGGVFIAANVEALVEVILGWWPDVDEAIARRVADTASRVLVSHGLAPEPRPDAVVAGELAVVLAAALDGAADTA